jgi:hypothetical protein
MNLKIGSYFAGLYSVIALWSSFWLTSVIAHMLWWLQLLYKRFSTNFLVNLLGKWKESEYSQSGQLIPVGGLVYYITPPAR